MKGLRIRKRAGTYNSDEAVLRRSLRCSVEGVDEVARQLPHDVLWSPRWVVQRVRVHEVWERVLWSIRVFDEYELGLCGEPRARRIKSRVLTWSVVHDEDLNDRRHRGRHLTTNALQRRGKVVNLVRPRAPRHCWNHHGQHGKVLASTTARASHRPRRQLRRELAIFRLQRVDSLRRASRRGAAQRSARRCRRRKQARYARLERSVVALQSRHPRAAAAAAAATATAARRRRIIHKEHCVPARGSLDTSAGNSTVVHGPKD